MGWRYYPAAKGGHLCLCPACISGGGYGDRKLLTSKLTGLEKKLSQSLSPQEQAKTVSAITELMGDHKLKLESWETVIDKVDLSDKDVVCELGYVLLQTNSEVALSRLIEIFKTASTDIKVSLVEPILLHKWDAGKDLLDGITNSQEVKAEIERFYARFDERE
jgi:hypothetical protein